MLEALTTVVVIMGTVVWAGELAIELAHVLGLAMLLLTPWRLSVSPLGMRGMVESSEDSEMDEEVTAAAALSLLMITCCSLRATPPLEGTLFFRRPLQRFLARTSPLIPLLEPFLEPRKSLLRLSSIQSGAVPLPLKAW